MATRDFATFEIPTTNPGSRLEFVWGHGWGLSHGQFLGLAKSLAHLGPSLLLDFPGFGASPLPEGAWGTADYADAVAAKLALRPRKARIWVGHSFGGRVGLQLGARHPEVVDGLVLIAAAGLPPRRSAGKRLKLWLRRQAYRSLRAVLPEGRREGLRRRFGSADYARAGALRPILVKVIAEDLSDVARSVRSPLLLLYGDRDRETPAEIGERLQALAPRATLHILRGYDHYDILTEGRHQVLHRLAEFAERVARECR